MKENYYILKGNDAKFILYKNDYDFNEGNKIKINGYFKEIRKQGVPYIFDYSFYAKCQGIRGQVIIENYEIMDNSITLRSKFINLLLDKLTYSKDAIRLIVFGINNEASESFYETLINLSIIHLFVISGFHFNFIYSFLKKIIKQDKIILIILFFYLYLLNFSLPALKSFMLLMLKKFDKNKNNNLFYLVIIAFIFILINPYVIFLSSFILTFILSFFLELIKVIVGNKKSLKYKLINILLPFLSVLPILINLNNKINLLSIFLQSIVSPFISLIYVISFLLLIFPGFDPYYFKLYLGMYDIFSLISSKTSYYSFSFICEGMIIFYYILLFLIYYNLYLKNKKKTLIIVYSLCLTLVGYNKYSFNNPSIYFLDVGQGDSILVRGKNNSYNFLIDTGGQYYSDVASKVHIPLFQKLGIKYLDAVFISHQDYDHSGALNSLSSQIKIKEIIDYSFDKYYLNNLLIYNLNNDINDKEEENEKSQVLYFKFINDYFLFCGDMTINNEKEFIDKYSSLKVDILKVAHHGSSSSSSEEFLKFINPSIAVISVGINNIYGHPSNVVLNRLIDSNVEVYRTDLMGTIVFSYNNYNKLKIYKTIL